MMRPVSLSGPELKMFLILWSLLQNPFFRESKRNRMEHEYESEREPRSILQVPLCRAFEEVSVSRGLGLFSAAMLICASSAPALAGEGGAVTGGVAGAVGGAMVGGPVGAVVGGLGGAAIGNAATGHRYYHHHGYAYHPYHHYYYHDR